MEAGDEIDTYMSPIGNNDSPYPYLIGKKNVYFIYETGFFQFVKRELIDLNADVIQQMIKLTGGKRVKKYFLPLVIVNGEVLHGVKSLVANIYVVFVFLLYLDNP